MKAHLTKVSLALLSAAFLLGCQEQGSSPVGPEGLGPGFANAKTKDCPAHPSCKPPSEDGQTVTVMLEGGMTGSLTFVKVFSDNGKKFAMNTTAQSSGTITMNFQGLKCSDEVPPHIDADDAAERVKRLEILLTATTVIDVSSPLFSLFNVKVDRTTLDLPDEKGNDLQVTYDPNDGFGGVILGWAHRDRATVSEDKDKGEFTFSGGQIRVGEEDGRPRDRIRILCSGAPAVTVTVTR